MTSRQIHIVIIFGSGILLSILHTAYLIKFPPRQFLSKALIAPQQDDRHTHDLNPMGPLTYLPGPTHLPGSMVTGEGLNPTLQLWLSLLHTDQIRDSVSDYRYLTARIIGTSIEIIYRDQEPTLAQTELNQALERFQKILKQSNYLTAEVIQPPSLSTHASGPSQTAHLVISFIVGAMACMVVLILSKRSRLPIK